MHISTATATHSEKWKGQKNDHGFGVITANIERKKEKKNEKNETLSKKTKMSYAHIIAT